MLQIERLSPLNAKNDLKAHSHLHWVPVKNFKSPFQDRDPHVKVRDDKVTVWDQLPLLEQIKQKQEHELLLK